MRRWFLPFGLVLGAVASVILAQGVAAAPQSVAAVSHRGGAGGGYFAVVCGFSHRNTDDPIVVPRQPGRSHDHTYFGARSTDASSTPASLREDGRTTCRLRADTAAYWAPTLLVGGGQFSAHADFVNSWNQATLARLVDRYLNRSGYGRRR